MPDLNSPDRSPMRLLEATGIPVITLDAQFRLRHFTPAAARAFNLEQADFGQPWGSDGTLAPILKAVRESSEPQQDEVCMAGAQGLQWFLRHVAPYESGLALAYLDITRYKQEAQVRRTLETVFQVVDEGIVVFDRDKKAILINEAEARINRFPDPAAMRQDLDFFATRYQLFLPDGTLLPVEAWPVSRVLRGERLKNLELRGRRLDIGEEWYFSFSGEPIWGADGQLSLAIIFTHDITDSKRAETDLRESEARFRTLADNIAQLAWMGTPDGKFFWFNQRWLEFTGMSLEESIHDGWKKLQHPEHLRRVESSFYSSLESGREWTETLPMRDRRGDYRWFLARAIPARDAGGKIHRWLGTLTDITDQREAEEHLRDASRRKDEFLAMLAHELRNPLSPIRTTLDWIASRREPLDPGLENALARISRQVSHLTHIVNDLLDTSRFVRGLIKLQVQPTRLADVLQQAWEDNRALLESQRQILHMSIKDPALIVEADPVRLTQIFHNLINNAAKYTPANGQIWVREYRERNQVRVEVTDTGMGIPANMLKTIFDVFYQADQSLARTKGGLGLGLTLVKRLTELHGGTVEARSPGPGMGSTFTIRLPLPPEQRRQPGAGTAAGRAQAEDGHFRVLVVEDNQDAAEALREMLEVWGYQAWMAHDGPSGLAQAIALSPDVVLLDIGLPGMDGYEVARRIHEESSLAATPIVAITGYNPDPQKRAAARFDDYFTKPVDLGRLERCLKELEHLKQARA